MIADINTPVTAIVGKMKDDSYAHIWVDGSNHAIADIDSDHRKIHSGNSYEYTTYRDQTVNHVWDIQITTPGGIKMPHFTYEFDAESETLWHFYENVNIILPGTAYVPRNHNRSSDKTSDVTMAYITNTNIGNANADTAVAGATVIAEGIAGSGKKIGGQGASRHEFVLKANEDYCFRWIASSAGWISWHFDWYEHTPKDV